MARTRVENRGDIRIITLDHGTTNAIDLEMVRALDSELDGIEEDESVTGVVLAGNEKFFSNGFDLPALLPLGEEEIGAFLGAMNRLSLRLFGFPKPTVVALTGHAVGGGCILAICCDYRYAAEGRRLISLPEVKLGLPVPYPADRMLVDIVGTRRARDIMESGDLYLPERALELGLVDRILPAGRLLEAAVEKAATLGAMPAQAYRRIKGNRVEPVVERVLARLEEREAAFLSFWFSDVTRPLLERAARTF
jgi:enoyl-CoA hydratase/carnithine racemase